MAEPYAFPALAGESLVVATGDSPHARSAEIVREAQAQAERIAKEAEKAGRAAGYAAGLEQARTELAPARQTLLEAARRLDADREAFVQTAERRAVELALYLAEKIVGKAIGADPTVVLSVVSGALRRLATRDLVVIEVNPADLELVRDQAAAVGAELGSVDQFEVVADRRIPRGGCVLRTSEGEIDARIPEQLARAAEVLYDPLLTVSDG
jgi:flagellar assembly protein FliH